MEEQEEQSKNNEVTMTEAEQIENEEDVEDI